MKKICAGSTIRESFTVSARVSASKRGNERAMISGAFHHSNTVPIVTRVVPRALRTAKLVNPLPERGRGLRTRP